MNAQQNKTTDGKKARAGRSIYREDRSEITMYKQKNKNEKQHAEEPHESGKKKDNQKYKRETE